MQSYDEHMEQLRRDEILHQKMMQDVADKFTPEELKELEKHGITAVPTQRTQVGMLGAATTVAAIKTAIAHSGRVVETTAVNTGSKTREDFPSRQAWRNYQRMVAKGQIK